VLYVKEESIPSRCAEAFSGDSLISISSFIDIITYLLNTSKDALSACDNVFNSLIISRSLLDLLSNINEDNSNESNESNDESSNGDRPSVVAESPLNSSHNFS